MLITTAADQTPATTPGSDGTPAAAERGLAAAQAVAADIPALADALAAARAADRAIAAAIEGLLDLQEHDLAEHLTGVALEQWLAIAGRRTASDRRMLLTACDALRRLPSLRAAFLDEARVSWSQTRTVALQVERLPHHLDDVIDAALARCLDATADDDPDVLGRVVGQTLRSIDPAPEAAAIPQAPSEPFLAIQPRLDGSGGRLYGDFDGLGLATIDAALTPPPHEARDGGPHRGAAARGRARRLLSLCDGALVGGTPVDGPGRPARPITDDRQAPGSDEAPGADAPRDEVEGPDHDPLDAGATGSRPQLLLRVPLSSLLGEDELPGELVTRLLGGSLRADATTVRALVDERGADLRALVLDDTGNVVGVGRRTRVPEGWLRDAILALHDTCSAPACERPARSCDVDHATPWHPTVPGAPGGRTDVDQLAPLCRTHNRTKESAGWEVNQTADGVRRWLHRGTGLATTTRPSTWRPPPVPSPPARGP